MIEITGMDALMSNLNKKFNKIERDADQAVSQAVEECESEAKSRVRVATGATRDSIVHQHSKQAGLSESVVSVGTPYSPFLEMRYPFLFPAYMGASVRFADKLKKLL